MLAEFRPARGIVNRLMRELGPLTPWRRRFLWLTAMLGAAAVSG